MELIRSDFGSVAHSLALTLAEAKNNGETLISIPKDTYHVYEREAMAPVVCVANHGHNGFKHTAIAIENMNDRRQREYVYPPRTYGLRHRQGFGEYNYKGSERHLRRYLQFSGQDH